MGQLYIDEDHYPGGRMAGFSLWIQQQWRDFMDYMDIPQKDPHPKLFPRHVLLRLMVPNVDELFDKWLAERVDGLCART
jgi:hypothetical protein